MLGLMFVFAGAMLVILGPIPSDIAYLNQMLGAAMIIGGPWAVRQFFNH